MARPRNRVPPRTRSRMPDDSAGPGANAGTAFAESGLLRSQGASRPRAIHHAVGWALVTSRVEERTVSRGSVRAVRGRGLRAGGWRDDRARNPPPRVRILGLRRPAAVHGQHRPGENGPPAAPLLLV